jgi:hypothetical protein
MPTREANQQPFHILGDLSSKHGSLKRIDNEAALQLNTLRLDLLAFLDRCELSVAVRSQSGELSDEMLHDSWSNSGTLGE